MSGTEPERRVAVAAEQALARRKYATVAEVCIGLGWLHERHVDAWRQARVADLGVVPACARPAGPDRRLPAALGRGRRPSVRHQDTAYDELLMSGVARDDAREQIKDTIAVVLGTWA